jgi:hypothetical protein
MIRKLVFAVILVTAMAAAGHAVEGDNAAALPAGDVGRPPGSPSFFEGVWAGSWPSYMDPTTKQDITIAIRPGQKEGFFAVVYEWGSVQFRGKAIPPGSLKAKGRQEGDRLVIQWKNKLGNEQKITLRKEDTNAVKARMDREGTLGPGERPYSETRLIRK